MPANQYIVITGTIQRAELTSSTQRSLHWVRHSTVLWYLILQSMKTMLLMMLNTSVLAKCLYTESLTRFRLSLSCLVVATMAENTHLVMTNSGQIRNSEGKVHYQQTEASITARGMAAIKALLPFLGWMILKKDSTAARRK